MVHQYQLNGYNIVLDTCSGSVHVVDEVAYDVIAMYPDHTADEIVAAMMAKYGALQSQGLLSLKRSLHTDGQPCRQPQ